MTLTINLTEAAKLVGVGRTQFVKWLNEGKVPGVVVIGARRRINRQVLVDWIDAQTEKEVAA